MHPCSAHGHFRALRRIAHLIRRRGPTVQAGRPLSARMDLEQASAGQLYRLLILLLRQAPPPHLFPLVIYILSSSKLPGHLLQQPLPTTGRMLVDLAWRYGSLEAVCLLLS